jgi:DNA-binding MarR family transcriptional regulator
VQADILRQACQSVTVNPSEREQQRADAARVASDAVELLEVLWGRAVTGPVSASQLRAMFILEQNDGINLRTLAGAMDSTPPSVSRLCDRLEAMGAIERTPSPASRREVRLHLSKSGLALMDELRARRVEELQRVLARMPSGKRQALVRGLEAFRDAAHDELRGETDGDARTA